MNKQNMIEHVESGFRVWSLQKDTSLSVKVKVLKGQSDNPMVQNMVPVHLEQNGTLSLEHRHSTSTASRCEEHGLPRDKDNNQGSKGSSPAPQHICSSQIKIVPRISYSREVSPVWCFQRQSRIKYEAMVILKGTLQHFADFTALPP